MLSKIAIVIIVFVVSFFAFSKPNTRTDENAKKERSSISFINGKYKIDTAVIQNNFNKKSLITWVETQKLTEKKNQEEIPRFIKEFLDSKSENGKFEMANPGEEWKCGITDFGHQVIKKVYDPNKKDSVLQVSWDGKRLPDKQFVYFAIGQNIALFSYYFRTGQRAAIIKFKNEKITDFWYDANLSFVKTKSEIIKELKTTRKNNGC